MDNAILSINPDRQAKTAIDPYVVRLPDGHVRVTAESVAFPETCPRCGSAPANTKVRLGLRNESSQTISIPFCRRCGLTLNITQYLFVGIVCLFWWVVIPNVKVPAHRWLPKVPSIVLFTPILCLVSWAFQQAFKLFCKPRIEVVAGNKDSIELAFEDQMYAEKFVAMNR